MVAISDPKRKSGISILGDAPWGTHFCHFYHTKQDLIDVLVPYIKTGLENNEFCMWVTSEPLNCEEARAELQKAVKDLDQYNKKGQIEILDFSQWYTRTGRFDADKVLQGWVDKEQQARKNGFEGLRLTGNTFWIEHKDWKSFSDYEATINNVIHNYKMLAICSYSLDKCDASDILDVFSTHQFALLNHNGKWATIESAERKQAEEALKKSAQLSRDIGEMAKVGGWELALSTKEVSWTEEVGRVHGVEPGYKPKLEEAIKFYAPESRPGVEAVVKKAAETGEPYDLESLFIPSGSTDKIWVRSLGKAVYSGGKIVKLAGTFQNIDKYKRAEEALRDSERRYRTLFESANDAILIFEPENEIILEVNQKACETYGFAKTELVGMSLKKLTKDVARGDQQVAELLRTGTYRNFETVHLRADGTPIDFLASSSLIEYGGQRAILSVMRDVTERRQSEKAVQESEERLRTIVEASLDAIVAVNAEGRIVLFNDAAQDLFQYSKEDALKQPAKILLREEMGQIHQERLERFLNAGLGQCGHIGRRMEKVFRRKDGSLFEGEVSMSGARLDGLRLVVLAVHDITERKRVEQELHESEERYRSLVEAAPDVIYTVSAEDGSLTSLNPAFETLTGWSRAEWLGKPLVGIVHPDDLPVAVETLQKASRGETQPPFELRVLSKSGEYLVGEFTSTPHVKDGKVVGELGIARDITGRQRAEEALRDSEKRFRLLFERAPLSYQSLNENGCFIDVSPAWLAVFGYTREEVIGRWFGDFMTPESAEAVKKNFPCFKAAGEIYGLEYEMVRKDGSHFIASVNGKIGYDEHGRFAQTHCILADITERKRAEEALRESQEMFQKAFHASPDTMVLHSLSEGRYIDVNESFLRLVGYRREELVGRTAMDLGLWWDLAQGNEYLRILREQGRVRDLEICVRTKSGEAHTLLLSAEVIEIAGQDCVVAIGKDIRERKQAEQERTHLEEQLRQAQKMEAVGRLAGGVAHDFNNILMVINGYAQLVLRRLSPRHPLRQNLNEIRKAGERAASLTGQLLAFSRRQILVPRILDLNKVVADTKEMLRRVIGEDVELVIRQGHKLAKVLADPDQIAEVLVNLAVNARDAMPGGGRLTIETGNVDLREAETGDLPGAAPGPYVMLAVSDTGVGMSKEVMEHMFEPFFTTRERGKGTGLGLSTVYGIVKQSGGYVRAQSEPGQGSAFRIYLPCARVGSGKPAARSAKARLAKGRETVLVVEDELAVRQVVAATLRSCGYKVLEAGSGEEAMRRLRRHEGPLHLLLTDLVMPRMNGRKVADSVRTLYPEVKVVFMSGYTDDALLRHGVSDTQGSFLQKPFTMETLTQEVREVFGE